MATSSGVFFESQGGGVLPNPSPGPPRKAVSETCQLELHLGGSPHVDHNHPGAGNGRNTKYVWDAKPFRKVEVSPRFRAVNADGLPESDEAAWGHPNLESRKHASALS